MAKMLMSILVLFVVSASIAGFDGAGALNITVRDQSGRPISDATVYAIPSEGVGRRVPRFATDANGRRAIKDLSPGNYEVHAFKESEGYPDTFFSFFLNGNNKSWKVVTVRVNQTTDVVLQLGPKYAIMELFVTDEKGGPSGGSLMFRRLDDPTRPYRRGGDLSGHLMMLVPSTPFRFEIQKDGYEIWRSRIITLRSGQTLTLHPQLRKARQQ